LRFRGRGIEHLGSIRGGAEPTALMKVGRHRIAPGPTSKEPVLRFPDGL